MLNIIVIVLMAFCGTLLPTNASAAPAASKNSCTTQDTLHFTAGIFATATCADGTRQHTLLHTDGTEVAVGDVPALAGENLQMVDMHHLGTGQNGPVYAVIYSRALGDWTPGTEAWAGMYGLRWTPGYIYVPERGMDELHLIPGSPMVVAPKVHHGPNGHVYLSWLSVRKQTHHGYMWGERTASLPVLMQGDPSTWDSRKTPLLSNNQCFPIRHEGKVLTPEHCPAVPGGIATYEKAEQQTVVADKSQNENACVLTNTEDVARNITLFTTDCGTQGKREWLAYPQEVVAVTAASVWDPIAHDGLVRVARATAISVEMAITPIQTPDKGRQRKQHPCTTQDTLHFTAGIFATATCADGTRRHTLLHTDGTEVAVGDMSNIAGEKLQIVDMHHLGTGQNGPVYAVIYSRALGDWAPGTEAWAQMYGLRWTPGYIYVPERNMDELHLIPGSPMVVLPDVSPGEQAGTANLSWLSVWKWEENTGAQWIWRKAVIDIDTPTAPRPPHNRSEPKVATEGRCFPVRSARGNIMIPTRCGDTPESMRVHHKHKVDKALS